MKHSTIYHTAHALDNVCTAASGGNPELPWVPRLLICLHVGNNKIVQFSSFSIRQGTRTGRVACCPGPYLSVKCRMLGNEFVLV